MPGAELHYSTTVNTNHVSIGYYFIFLKSPLTHMTQSFIICNQGYTIERFVHGPEESYHDIQSWRYKDLPSVFGATDSGYQSHIVHTMAHLEGLLSRKTFKHPSLLQVGFTSYFPPQ